MILFVRNANEPSYWSYEIHLVTSYRCMSQNTVFSVYRKKLSGFLSELVLKSVDINDFHGLSCP